MEYLISQLWLCLALATLLGGIIGWLLRGGGLKKLKLDKQSLKTRLTDIENERDDLALEVLDRKESHNVIVAERNNVLSKLDAMKSGATLARNALDESKAKLRESEATIKTLSDKLKDNEAQVVAVKEEGNTNNAELSKAKERLSAYQSKLSKSEASLVDLQQKLDDTEQQLVDMTTEAGDWSLKFAEADKTIDISKANLLDSASKLEVMQDMLASSNDGKSSFEESLINKNEQINTLKAKLIDSENNLGRITTKLSDTEIKLQSKKLELQDATRKLNAVKNDLVSSNDQLEASSVKINTLLDTASSNDDGSKQWRKSQDKLELTQSELSEAQSKLTKAKASNTQLQTALSKAEKSLGNNKVLVNDYKKQLTELQSSLDASKEKDTADHKTLQAKLAEAELTNGQLKAQLLDTEKSLSKHTSEVEDYKQQFSELQSSLDTGKEESTADHKALQAKLAEATSDNTQLKTKLLASEKSLSDYNSGVEDYKQQLSILQSSLDASEEKGTTDHKMLQAKLAEAESTNGQLKAQLLDTEKSLSKHTSEVEGYKQQLSALQSSLETSKEKGNADYKVLEAKLAEAESSNSQLQKKLSETKKSLSSDTSKVDNYKQQLTALQTSLDSSKKEAIADRQSLEAKLVEAESSNVQLKSKLSETEKHLSKHTSEIADYRQQLTTAQTFLDTNNKANEDVEGKLKKLQSKLSEAESNNSQLKFKLAVVEKSFRDNISETNHYKKQLEALEVTSAKQRIQDDVEQQSSGNTHIVSEKSSKEQEQVKKKGSTEIIQDVDVNTQQKKIEKKGIENSDGENKADTPVSVTEVSHSRESINEQSDYSIEEIQGIGSSYGKQLRKLGISTTSDMLKNASKIAEVKAIAKKLDQEPWVVRSWSSMSDLTRINGVDGQFAELIEFSGVHSTQSMALQEGKSFTATMKALNDKEKRVSKMPGSKQVSQWIGHAKTLTPILHNDLDKINKPIVISSYPIEEIEGIGPGYAKQLSKLSITTTKDMLDKVSSVEGVESVATSMSKQSWVIRSWASMSDLMRVEGVDGQFAELIEFSGVHSVQALGQQDAKTFTQEMMDVNDKEHRVKEAPDSRRVHQWITSAKTMPSILDDDLALIVATTPSVNKNKNDASSNNSGVSGEVSCGTTSKLATTMDYEIEEIEGVGKGYGKQLREMGYKTSLSLLQNCPDKKAINAVAVKMKQEYWVVESWVSMADLLRIQGVNGQFAELLYFSGIHSVQRLALFNATNLTKKMERTNKKEHRVKETPSVEAVREWIAIAKKLESMDSI